MPDAGYDAAAPQADRRVDTQRHAEQRGHRLRIGYEQETVRGPDTDDARREQRPEPAQQGHRVRTVDRLPDVRDRGRYHHQEQGHRKIHRHGQHGERHRGEPESDHALDEPRDEKDRHHEDEQLRIHLGFGHPPSGLVAVVEEPVHDVLVQLAGDGGVDAGNVGDAADTNSHSHAPGRCPVTAGSAQAEHAFE